MKCSFLVDSAPRYAMIVYPCMQKTPKLAPLTLSKGMTWWSMTESFQNASYYLISSPCPSLDTLLGSAFPIFMGSHTLIRPSESWGLGFGLRRSGLAPRSWPLTGHTWTCPSSLSIWMLASSTQPSADGLLKAANLQVRLTCSRLPIIISVIADDASLQAVHQNCNICSEAQSVPDELCAVPRWFFQAQVCSKVWHWGAQE